MEYNVEKCKVIHFDAVKQYSLNGERVEKVDIQRNLGVLVRELLKQVQKTVRYVGLYSKSLF